MESLKKSGVFVCPHFDKMPDKMQQVDRLCAYPRVPELPPLSGGFLLLDSGAFWLAKSKKRHLIETPEYLDKLCAHYRAHGQSREGEGERFCIAPDIGRRPARSMQNFARWMDAYAFPVAPVIHLNKTDTTPNIIDIARQCRFYSSYFPNGAPLVCFANGANWHGVERAENMKRVTDMIRKIMGARWIHCLGAGWSIPDIRQWLANGFDSCDSISYYTAAQSGESWDGDYYETWKERAVANAFFANGVTQNDL